MAAIFDYGAIAVSEREVRMALSKLSFSDLYDVILTALVDKNRQSRITDAVAVLDALEDDLHEIKARYIKEEGLPEWMESGKR